ncbi:MAG TPA: type II CAAX endopeptidase family protein [Verrucomicrobiota bacterium]|nr:type II CAAX endopeptidase family protein [Verrucomicrobiota bacterium]
MPSLGDHLLVVLIGAVYPVYFTVDWYRRIFPELKSGGHHSRVRLYRRSMIELWLLTSLVLSWWLWSGRAATAVGLGLPSGWGFWIGAILTIGLAIVLGRQVATVRSSAEARAQVLKQFSGVPGLMVPRDRHERRLWMGLSLTAGLCEEVLYRGFLIWYLMMLLPAMAAVLLAAIVFGAAHLYLGWGVGVLRATIVGVVLGVAYLVTGTLWVPMALHAIVDVTSGLTGSAAFEQAGPSRAEA